MATTVEVEVVVNTDALAEWINEVEILAVEAKAGVDRLRWKLNQRPGVQITTRPNGGRAPRCVDGSRVHDFKGQAVCPACGWKGIEWRR